MGQVAELAGIGMGTLYRHFPDKHALLLELFEYWSGQPAEARGADLQLRDFIQKDPHAALAGFLRRLYERRRYPNWFYVKILPGAHGDEQRGRRFQQLKDQGAERFAAIIEFGQQAGMLRKRPIPAIASVLVINALELRTAHVLSGTGSETEPVLAGADGHALPLSGGRRGEHRFHRRARPFIVRGTFACRSIAQPS
jgi:AcrR family transcriptional regulator